MSDARDHLERRKFHQPADLVELNLDQSGVFSIRGLQEAERLEGELRQFAQRIDAHVQEYKKRAMTELRGSAALQVDAWYQLRLQKKSALEVAADLGVSHQAKGGVSTVQQWAKRGAEKILRLALADEDQERAAVMRRAAG